MAKNSYSDMTELIKDYYSMSVGNYLNQSISINNVTLSCDIYKVEAETELTPSILTGCTEADANTQIIIGRDMSITSETTFIPPYRCKGIIIGDVGTFTNEGTISMTARGASGEGKNIQLTPDYMISAVGGAGASARARTIEYYNTGFNGDAGSAPTTGILSCGGGGSGAVTGSPGTYYTGAGGNGTSFSGGAGGGATVDSNGNAGSSTGGAGGNGKSGDSTGLIRGGAGNPKGTDSGSQTGSADSYGEGTGGLIVILARKLISSGSLTSNGSKAPGFTSGGSGRSNWAGGGASGGGCIVLISAENEVTSLTSVTGGAAGSHSGTWQKDGGAGGSGAYANITIEDLILVDLPVEFAITDKTHLNNIDPSEAVRFLGLMDDDELYYEIMGKRHSSGLNRVIKDNEGTILEKRKSLVINSPLNAEDDSTNEATVLDVDTNVDLSVIHAPGTRTPDEFEVAITNPQEGQVMRYNETSEQWENGDDYHVYSTDERVVGKWIDGKPLYESTVIINNSISQGDNYTDLSISNLEMCYIKDGYFKYNDVYNDGTEPIYYPLNIYKVKWNAWTTLDFGISTFIQRNHSTGIFRIVSRSSAAVTNIVQSIVVIRYTKTTDTV